MLNFYQIISNILSVGEVAVVLNKVSEVFKWIETVSPNKR